MATRPNMATTMLRIADILSMRSTCSRRNVGAIFLNKHNHIVASGYNGVASGLPHCIDSNCKGSNFKSGEGLDSCEAIHAEQNALMQCRDIFDIESVFCTTSPCVNCIKMLMNTSARDIYFIDDYPHTDAAKQLWMSSCKSRTWNKYEGNIL